MATTCILEIVDETIQSPQRKPRLFLRRDENGFPEVVRKDVAVDDLNGQFGTTDILEVARRLHEENDVWLPHPYDPGKVYGSNYRMKLRLRFSGSSEFVYWVLREEVGK